MKKFKVGDMVYEYYVGIGFGAVRSGLVKEVLDHELVVRIKIVDKTVIPLKNCFHSFREAAEAMIEAYYDKPKKI
jgi:hypothetical protein